MRYDWNGGDEIRRARCYDRDTGEEVPDPVTWVDEEAGTLERVVFRNGRYSLETEHRRVRVVFVETREEAEAFGAEVKKHLAELRAAHPVAGRV